MSSHRESHVWIAPAEPRCEPSALPQRGRFTCGRYKALVPKMGKVEDFNRLRLPSSPPCEHYLSSELKPPTLTVEPRRLPPLGG